MAIGWETARDTRQRLASTSTPGNASPLADLLSERLGTSSETSAAIDLALTILTDNLPCEAAMVRLCTYGWEDVWVGYGRSLHHAEVLQMIETAGRALSEKDHRHTECSLRDVTVRTAGSSPSVPASSLSVMLFETLALPAGAGCVLIARQEPFTPEERESFRSFVTGLTSSLQRIDATYRAIGAGIGQAAQTLSEALFLIDQGLPPQPLNERARALAADPQSAPSLTPESWLAQTARNAMETGRIVSGSLPPDSGLTGTATISPTTSSSALIVISQPTIDPGLRDHIIESERLASIGRLVSGVAHEVNNPLTAIMGFAQLSLMRDLDTQTHNDMQTILQESTRAYYIVQNLLDFARQRPPAKSPLSLNQLVQRVVDLRSYDTRLAGIETILDLDPELPLVMGDQYQVQQMIFNVLLNAEQAVKATAQNHGAITVTSRGLGEHARIEITDTGAGIPDDVLPRIFEPFVTGRPTGSGTGLGLSISYGIVSGHGGTITARNLPGGGATFTIELPAGQVEAAAYARAESEASPAVTPIMSASILVVDDEPSIRRLLSGVLAMADYDVEVADSAGEALEILATRSFDALITDLRMPGMDGPRLYAEIQRSYSQLARHTGFITGDSITKGTRKFLEDSGRPYLEKPFLMEHVRALAEQLVHG